MAANTLNGRFEDDPDGVARRLLNQIQHEIWFSQQRIGHQVLVLDGQVYLGQEAIQHFANEN